MEILENTSKAPESDLHEYKRFAYSEIGEWNNEELALKLPNLIEFQRRNGYPEISEIDSHVIPTLESLNGKEVTGIPSGRDAKAEGAKSMRVSAIRAELRIKSQEEVDREYGDAVLQYAKN